LAVLNSLGVEGFAKNDGHLPAFAGLAIDRIGPFHVAAENLIAPLDENRQQRDFAFERDVGGAVLHLAELAGGGAGAFWVDQQNITLFDFFLGNDQAADRVAETVDSDAAATRTINLPKRPCWSSRSLAVRLASFLK